MLARRRDAICRMTGIQDAAQAPVINAGDWSTFSRRRLVFSTLPAGGGLVPTRRPVPWDQGWLPLVPSQRAATTMTRARGSPGEPLRASTYQYAPEHLLYQVDSRWDRMCPNRIGAHIRDHILPRQCHEGWVSIRRGDLTPATEPAATVTAQWIAQHGAAHGFRIPNTAERGRAMGMLPYLAGLGLDDRTLFDAQGNAFDRALLGARLGGHIGTWLAGASLPRHVFPSAHDVAQEYALVRAYVQSRGHTPAPSPLSARTLEALAQLPSLPAAEDGRGAP